MVYINQRKGILVFMSIYLVLIGSTIFFANTNKSNQIVNNDNTSKIVSHKVQQFPDKGEENDNAKKKASPKRPSNQLMITAVSLASVLDIAIILVWARYENKKRKAVSMNNIQKGKRWRDKNGFGISLPWESYSLKIIAFL